MLVYQRVWGLPSPTWRYPKAQHSGACRSPNSTASNPSKLWPARVIAQDNRSLLYILRGTVVILWYQRTTWPNERSNQVLEWNNAILQIRQKKWIQCQIMVSRGCLMLNQYSVWGIMFINPVGIDRIALCHPVVWCAHGKQIPDVTVSVKKMFYKGNS